MGTAAQVEPAIAWDEALGGWTVSSCEAVRLALLNPAVYAEAGEFDIRRRSRPHLGFSSGRHQCIGMHLARVEAQVLIGRILAELPCLKIVEVDYGDHPVVHGPQRLLVSLA